MGLGLTDHGPYELLDDWVKGFWALLSFAMQMCILLVTGFMVADSPLVRRGIDRFVTIPKTRTQAVILYSLVLCVLWWLHWGIGMMSGVIMGRELCARKRGMGLHYPMFAAISYTAIACSNGPSEAAQLLMATPGHFMESVTGVIPIALTTFDIHLLVLNAILFVVFTVVFVYMHPAMKDTVEISEELAKEFTAADVDKVDPATLTPAQKMDRSPYISMIIAIGAIVWIVNFIMTKGIGRLDLNTLNFIFMTLSLILHKTPRRFVASLNRGIGNVAGIVIQFPFYAGIFGMIQYSGLAGIIAGWFVQISTAESFPLITYIYSGILNIFVPSGGSKFIIEAPYIVPAAKEVGAHLPYVINAYTSGDLITNLIQPFWALPILGAYRLKFQDILPYSIVIMVILYIIIAVAIYFFPMWF
jgi:short-chain fatty acids transporter